MRRLNGERVRRLSPRVRVAEKTLELNITAEILPRVRALQGCQSAFWTGMKQAQEAVLGFDEMISNTSGAVFLYLQFKAPYAQNPAPGDYQFSINSAQHARLVALAAGKPDSVFYVFPRLNSFQSLAQNSPNLVAQTQFASVAGIGVLAEPPSRHRVVSSANSINVFSDPLEVLPLTLSDVLKKVAPQGSLVTDPLLSFRDLVKLVESPDMKREAVASRANAASGFLVFPPPDHRGKGRL